MGNVGYNDKKRGALKVIQLFWGESAFEDRYKVEKSEEFLQVFNNLLNLNF